MLHIIRTCLRDGRGERVQYLSLMTWSSYYARSWSSCPLWGNQVAHWIGSVASQYWGECVWRQANHVGYMPNCIANIIVINDETSYVLGCPKKNRATSNTPSNGLT